MVDRKKVAVVLGTRPEAIKLAPVIQTLAHDGRFEPRVVATGQHREMFDQVMQVFGLAADRDLEVMRPGQGLPELTARMIPALDAVFAEERPDLVLVQGDTTTVFAAALAAFYRQIPVGHVEAGLRSGDAYDPFPEEANRRLTTVLTTLHFAPTERARRNLLAEGVPAERVFVTGNTVVDALRQVAAALPATGDGPGRRTILMTMHRRENWGAPIAEVCHAVADVLAAHPDVGVLFPVHRNPVVRESVQAVLGDHPRVALREPLDYFELVEALRGCALVLTDSGGIQEEAPTFGKPVLVLRETTERPEAIEAGCARLVGTARGAVAAELSRLLDDADAYAAMARVANPFGDGRAAERIVAAIAAFLGSGSGG